MARRKHRPTDPAEAARKRREQEAQTRRNPALWGVNEEALAMQADISDTPENRGKTRRVFRFDCFETLSLPDHDRAAVHRLETLIAVRFRVDGQANAGAKVDSSGSAELVTSRSLAAGAQIDAIAGWMPNPSVSLLLALLTPQTVEGVRVNWKATVTRLQGLTDRDLQSKAVKRAAADLTPAFARWDDGERPVKMARAA
jgi:hypothetical protein